MTETLGAVRFLPVPATTCQQSLDNWGWAATSTFAVGGWDLGIRSSTAELDAAVRALLGHRLRPDLQAPQNYSLFQAPRAAPEQPQRMHELFQGCSTRWRCRSTAELVKVLLLQLEGDRLMEQDDLLALTAVVGVVDGAAVLVPTTFRQPFLDAIRSLIRRGTLLWPASTVGLDPTTGEVVLPAADLEVDPEGWRLLPEGDGPEREIPAPGRYPVRIWLELQWRRDPEPLTRARALLSAFEWVRNRELVGPRRTLAGLATVLGSSQVRPLLLEGDVTAAIHHAIEGD